MNGVNEIIPWYQQKTIWTLIAGMIGALGTALAGDITWIQFGVAACLGVSGIFARQGIEKSTYIPPLAERGEEIKP